MSLFRFRLIIIVSLLLPVFVFPARDQMSVWFSAGRDYIEPEFETIVSTHLEYSGIESQFGTQSTTSSVPQDHRLDQNGRCTLTAEEVEIQLYQYNSPAYNEGLGELSVVECQRTGIDNSYWLLMFIYESGAGSNPAWSGNKGNDQYTGNTGNIICIPGYNCYGRFIDFNGDWEAGTRKHFQLLQCYRTGGGENCSGLWNGRSHNTIQEAIATWAPPNENDTQAYVDFVVDTTDQFRQIKAGQVVIDGEKGELRTFLESVFVRDREVVEAPVLELSGCLGTNVNSAMSSSPGLWRVELEPGEDWSFNETWIIDFDTLVECHQVTAGGLCDLAGRYSYVFRNLGLEVQSVYHGFQLNNLPVEDSISIWSTGQRGNQDLIVRNVTDKTVIVEAEMENNQLFVKGYLK